MFAAICIIALKPASFKPDSLYVVSRQIINATASKNVQVKMGPTHYIASHRLFQHHDWLAIQSK
jgi:hypothetical protein